MEWPRSWVNDKDDYEIASDVVPQAVKKATSYIALRVIQGVETFVDSTPSNPNVFESSVKVGPISVSEKIRGTIPTRTSFPDVSRMLAGLITRARIELGG